MQMHNQVAITRLLCLIVAVCLALTSPGAADEAAPSANAGVDRRGLWLLPRKDAANTGRSELAGNFRTAPSESWWIGATKRPIDWMQAVVVGDRAAYLAGDIDGDGRDNFLVGLSNGDLVALDEVGGKGVVLWKARLDAAIRNTCIADLDGDGRADLLVETDDGRVRVFRSPASRR